MKAQFDDEMQLRLKPALFHKITQIGTLFVEEKRSHSYYRNKMLEKLKSATFRGKVKLVSKLEIVSGIAAIIKPR